MSNGGIIGPVNDPIAFTVTASTTSFTSSGTFTSQLGQTKIDYLVVAGGGGGGSVIGGGGGGGGFRTGTCFSISPSTAYPITVGAGGAGGPYPTGTGFTGSPSIFSSIT